MWIAPLLILAVQQDAPVGTRVIRGTVTLEDEAGRQLDGTNGSLLLNVGGLETREWLIPYRDGAFELRLDDRATWVDVFSAWTALGPARVHEYDSQLSEDVLLDIRPHIVPPLTLHVLDAVTTTPLDCVDVLPPACGAGVRRALSHLDGAAVEIGPLFGGEQLDWRDGAVWIVRAPGRVEERVILSSDTPQSIVVYLERAGSLEFVLEHSPSTRHTYVEVESPDKELVFRECGRVGSRQFLEGLKPGLYVARVVHEFLDYRRVVLAETHVEVRADIVVSTKLVAAKPPADDTDGPP